MLSSHRKLQNRPPLIPKPGVNMAAFSIPLECFDRFTRVAVHLPAARARTVFSSMLNKPNYIIQRIAQKNADFVGKGITLLQPGFQTAQGIFRIQAAVAELG